MYPFLTSLCDQPLFVSNSRAGRYRPGYAQEHPAQPLA